ncbi:MAG: RHS repeat-associated core domain-containing protein, partial [Schleiferiaceae bacterium]
MNRASIGAISFRYSYNRLLSRTMPGSSGNDLYDVVYTYGTLGDGKNGAGRIVTIDQGQGFKVDHFSYDELGQRVVEQSTIQVPQVGQRTYQTEFKYSSFGRILQASYPDGDVVNYHYTDKGELFSIESTAPGEPKLFVVQETQYNGFGQIGTLIYGNGTKTTYNYASSDFVTSGLGHLNKTALFTSTVEGKATLGGATTSLASRDYQYSNLGMVSSLNKSIHSSLAAGITSLDYSFSYDDKGRLLGSTLATGGMNIYELTMGYNAVGGITSKDSDLPNGGHPLVNPNLKYDLSYSYNPAKPHQLLSVTEVGPNGGITNFSYDDVGNLTESFGPSGTEELIWNELQQLSGVMNGNGIHHYVYDHNGERIMKSSINRSWVQVNDQNVDDIQYLEPYTLYVNPYYVVTSFHNGDHISKHYYMNTQRVATDISINYQGPPPPIAPGAPMSSDSAQSTGMGISASFEDDLNIILQQFDAGDLSRSLSENGIVMEKYYPNAASESESINRILYWYHPDYLGSVDLVTDRNGVAYEFFLYTPWGEDMYSYNAGASSFTSPYRFNGKEKDPETGYSYYGARYYQSKFSIWMSVDPLAHETLEPYLFTGNNPIMLVDPTGMNSEEPGEDKGWFGNLLCKVADWFNPREPAQFKEEPEEKPANVSDAGFPEMLQQVDIVEDAIEPSSDQAITTIPIEPPGIPLPLFTAPSGATAAKALRWLGWISIILTIPGDKRAEDQDLYYPPPKSLPGFPGAERVPN